MSAYAFIRAPYVLDPYILLNTIKYDNKWYIAIDSANAIFFPIPAGKKS